MTAVANVANKQAVRLMVSQKCHGCEECCQGDYLFLSTASLKIAGCYIKLSLLRNLCVTKTA